MSKVRILAAALMLLACTAMGVCENAKGSGAIIGTYTVNDQIVINTIGNPEGKPITSGFMDHKPVWSMTGNWIVFFRIKKNSPVIAEWENAICVIHTDGTGFKELTDGRHHDFNPTWMRDGSNRIFFNRTVDGKNKIFITSPDANPGDERAIGDPQWDMYAHSSLPDGRIFVTRITGIFKEYVFLMTLDRDLKASLEPIRFTYPVKGRPERASISPSGRKIVYELNLSFVDFTYSNHPLVVADFDPETATCSNPVVITHAKESVCDIYARWVKDESAIVYMSNRDGHWQLYMYTLEDRKTRRVSTQGNADYKYFCGENSPY